VQQLKIRFALNWTFATVLTLIGIQNTAYVRDSYGLAPKF